LLSRVSAAMAIFLEPFRRVSKNLNWAEALIGQIKAFKIQEVAWFGYLEFE
jgi:hypothetical protein